MLAQSIRDCILWIRKTPDRALRAAKEAADLYQNIQQESRIYQNLRGANDATVILYLDKELSQYERTVKLRLQEFRVSSALLRGFEASQTESAETKKMVEEIEMAISRSQFLRSILSASSVKTHKPLAFEKTGIIPRSIPRTFDRLRRELLASSEDLVVQEFRISRYQTLTSLKFLASLIWIPWIVSWFLRVWWLEPTITMFWNQDQTQLFLHRSQEERALSDMRAFQEKVYFEVLVGEAPDPTPEVLQRRIQAKARDLAEASNQNSIESLANLGSDILACLILLAMLSLEKTKIAVLKSFLDELIYSLNDATKAFFLILVTDVFVGFHSTHGWEVILELLFAHFGFPESKKFIFMFVATFPVLLDTVFKYWIFRYLNHISPSTVAVYHNMNE
uniref:Potassium/proton antiporter CemA n=1 Tax=Nephroselmis olivacea TaxID=31312 RepID=CEMA_NEPOL|nr:envelope membrane protein [Nephroselmis olivacea]Q9TKZ2.1 RecName: Full=Potassium/proton antiporter CemA; AltName: Full=Chloroplast envelope membrane protein A; Short=CemA [Nephroselmis olivacea]AAD54824.1 chloroplast envelope membrane protein [Nephroselmis olivacea]